MATTYRYIAGTAQSIIDQDGRQTYDGIDEHQPFAVGRTVPSVLRQYLVEHGHSAPRVWDRKVRQFIEFDA